jgi:tetratricopeptide (TPR) repeat protein
MRCPVCGSKISDDAKFCPVCKTRLTDGDAEFACPMCGSLVDSNAEKCPSCGAEFADDEQVKKSEILPAKSPDEPAGATAPEVPLVSAELEELVKLKGVGPLKARALYDAGFADLRSLKSATVKELAAIKGIGKKTAAQIKSELTKIDLDGIRSSELTADDVEAERQCNLCGTILSAFETSCYECGMIFDKSSTIDAKEADLKALEFYEKKLQSNPSDTEVWYARGSTLVKLNRFREALASFDQVTDINPKYDGAWIAKADVHRKLGEAKQAAECYNRVISATGAINLLPKNVEAGDDDIVSQDDLKEFDLELSQPLVQGGKRLCSTCSEPMPDGATSCPVCGSGYVPAPDAGAEAATAAATPKAESVAQTAEAASSHLPAEPASATDAAPPEPVVEPTPAPDARPEDAPSPPQNAAPEPAVPIPDATAEAAWPAVSAPHPMVKVAKESEPDTGAMDDKGLYQLLSSTANELKPLLALSKEHGIDVSEGRRLISEAIIYGKKKDIKKAVDTMLEGKKSVRGAMKLRFLREISSLENSLEDARSGGANVAPASKSLRDAKECLKAGSFSEIPPLVANAKATLDAFKKALGG